MTENDCGCLASAIRALINERAGPQGIDVREALSALCDVTARIAIEAGCDSPERMQEFAENIGHNVLVSLENLSAVSPSQ